MYNRNIIYHLCQYIYVFYAKNFFCMNRQYLFRGFWSRETFLTKQRKCLRTFGRDADAQRLSRLRRAHSAVRAYGGRTASLSRLRRARSAFRAYGVPYKSKMRVRLLSAPQGKHKRAQPWENSRGWAFLVYREDAFPFILSVGLSQSLRCNVLRLHCPAGWCKRPCSGPACRWHRLCNSSRCRPSPRTASSAHRHCRR